MVVMDCWRRSLLSWSSYSLFAVVPLRNLFVMLSPRLQRFPRLLASSVLNSMMSLSGSKFESLPVCMSLTR